MEKYDVTGMHCAACSAAVERAVSKVDGVSSVTVSLLTNSMTVEGGSAEDIVTAVKSAGYGAKPANETRIKTSRKESFKILIRLIISVCLLVPLMIISMRGMNGYVQAALSLAVIIVNFRFYINGFKGVIHLAPNMDTLVAMGSGTAFCYSVYVLLTGGNEFYFESAAMILTLITVGKLLESYSKGRTTDALKELIELTPKTATVIDENGNEKTIAAAKVQVGDIFVVRPGEAIPVDGTILEGSTSINEAAITGESIPADKDEGGKVSAGTINLTGFIKCRADAVLEDTTLSQIIKMVENAAATKAPAQKLADKVSGIFVPVVLGIAVITFVIWLIIGETVGFAIARGISVLVISCPCALGLATPVAIMVGSGVGARHGILFKTAEALEEAGKIKTIAFDKTGTVTKGEPRVTDIIPLGISKDELITYAASLEAKSEHPLAKAVMAEVAIDTLKETTDFEIYPGGGLACTLDGSRITGGSLKFISSRMSVDESIAYTAGVLSEQGKTPLLFTKDDKVIGIIGVADTLKDDSTASIEKIRKLGVDVVMITGDNEKTAKAVAEAAGIDKVYAGVLPNEKAEIIQELSKNGHTAMVGDGINDAPALTSANVGIAVGAGTDVAIDSAQIVLTNSGLRDVLGAVRLSRATLMNIRENLFWAFIYNIICIPLAAGVLPMDPMYGAAAMSLSSFCVVMNALRLNLFNVYGEKKRKEKKNMEITINVKGMMCGHCEARVKDALEKIPGVSSAAASHEKGTVVVNCAESVSADILKAAITAAGYEAE